jgi:hypothetical protein
MSSSDDDSYVVIQEGEFWEQIAAGQPMDDRAADALFAQVLALLAAGDPAWIRRIKKTRFLTCVELLALILQKIRETEDSARDEKKAIVDWAQKIKEAVKKELIVGFDHDSYIPVSLVNEEGWNWKTSLHCVDKFFDQTDNGWRGNELLNSFENEGKQKPIRKKWGKAELKVLREESLLPEATSASLAKKYGVTPQRINALLRRAKSEFSPFRGKPTAQPRLVNLTDRKPRVKNKQ